MRTIPTIRPGTADLIGRRQPAAPAVELDFPASYQIRDSWDAGRVARALLLGAPAGTAIVVYLNARHRASAWATLTRSWLDAAFSPPGAVIEGATAIGGAAAFFVARLHADGELAPLASEALQAARLRTDGAPTRDADARPHRHRPALVLVGPR